MMPPGHFAVGYLLGKILSLGLDPSEQNMIIWVTAFSAAIPDLDEFWSFKRIGRLIGSTKETNHRNFFTHTPFFHLLLAFGIGLVCWSLGFKTFFTVSTAYFLGAVSHFLLDSTRYGIMWFWPLNRRLYSTSKTGIDFAIDRAHSDWDYWMDFLKKYSKEPLFIAEILTTAVALIIFYRLY